MPDSAGRTESEDIIREETEEERIQRVASHKVPPGKPKSEWDEADWENFSEFYVDENGYA